MSDSIILMVTFPLIIAGMILTITWGMSAAGVRRRDGGKHSQKLDENRLVR